MQTHWEGGQHFQQPGSCQHLPQAGILVDLNHSPYLNSGLYVFLLSPFPLARIFFPNIPILTQKENLIGKKSNLHLTRKQTGVGEVGQCSQLTDREKKCDRQATGKCFSFICESHLIERTNLSATLTRHRYGFRTKTAVINRNIHVLVDLS